jgi:hypothetical protein
MRTALAVLALTICASALGADDVALVNDLRGKVTYVVGSRRVPAEDFMRVREGDRFIVGTDARVRVLYLASGRSETYRGPARFLVGRDGGKLESGAAPQVSTLPSGVSENVGKTTQLLASARMSSLGGVTLRGAPVPLTDEDKRKLAAARETYAQLRERAAPQDITPEFYLYPVLQHYRQTGDMKALVADMRRRQPNNRDVQALAAALGVP